MSKLVFDYETTSLNPRKGRVFGYVLTDESGNSEVFDLDYPGRKGRIARSRLKTFWADTSIEKIAHNVKFELHYTLRAEGITIPPDTVLHDTMIMSQILNNLEASHKLEDLASLYCQDPKLVQHWKTIDAKVKREATFRGRYDRVDRKLMHEYQINDGFRAMLLFQMYKDPIQKYWDNYRWEIDIIKATQRMEDFGLQPSLPNILELRSHLGEETITLQNDLFYAMKGFYNYNSDDVLRKFLYEYKDYEVHSTTTGGQPAVDKDAFFHFREEYPEDQPILDKILKYRSYMKGISMLDNYLSYIDPVTGLIYHSINTNSARTGRQSAKNPNMQNVAKDNALKNPFPVPARRSFVAREDSLLLFVDYAGIEMRLIVEATKEPLMVKVLNEGGDMHSVAAEYWFGKMFTDQEVCLQEYLPHNEELSKEYEELKQTQPLKEVKETIYLKARKILRGASKNTQFGLAYGAAFGVLVESTLLPPEILRPGYDSYRKTFPLIANFTPHSMHLAKKDGYVTTSFGRRLYIERGRLHTAANYRIQGTAAEMLKRSTVLLDNYLQKHYPDVRLIVPIHDELMIHVPKKYQNRLPELTKEWGDQMTIFPELAVPIEVEWEVSDTTWNDKIDLDKFIKERGL